MNLTELNALASEKTPSHAYNDPEFKIDIGEGMQITIAELDEVMDILPLDTDSYKVSMPMQYPPGTTKVRVYTESRGGEFDRVLHAGIQPYIDKISKPVTQRQVDIADILWRTHGEPFPKAMWDYIVRVHDGLPPVHIRSVAEGMVIPTRNVLVVTENTDEDMPTPGAIVTWCETGMLRATWYPSSVGTTSWVIKQHLKDWWNKTVDNDKQAGVLFALHDFGSRGVSSAESARIGGGAHLFNFRGTDTFAAVLWLMRHYAAPVNTVAWSIKASEHSTVTSWGREHEDDAALNMATHFASPDMPFAFVIDSYSALKFTNRVSNAESKVLAILKERKATMVLRPDSGDPVSIIPQMLAILERNVGSTLNSKGFKVLNHFKIIWGDGINRQTIEAILRMVCGMLGYSAENFAFGMGGALLQIINRDSQEYATKCCAIMVNGEWRDVYKQPEGVVSKASKRGRVMLYKNADGKLVNLIEDSPESKGLECMLHNVFYNGYVVKRWTLEEARTNTELPLLENATAGHSSSVYAPMV